MKKVITLMAILLCTYGISRAQRYDTLVAWEFPTGTGADSIATSGQGTNLSDVIRIDGGLGAMYFSATGSSGHSVATNEWKTGANTKYWTVTFNTTNYDSLFFTSSQKSSTSTYSGVGPRDFSIEYMIGTSGTWTLVHSDTVELTSRNWRKLTDSLPYLCNNTSIVSLRWVVTDTISATGGAIGATADSYIKNIKVWGHNISGAVYPTVTKATLTSLTTATVIFSTPVNSTGALAANYTGLGTVTATLSTTQDTANLTFASLTNGNAYILTVAHVHDNTSNLADSMYAPQSFHFLMNTSVDTLVITEINYKTPGTTSGYSSAGDSLSYIELFNNSAASSRVGGYMLKSGNSTLYTFPGGTILSPNEYLVFAYDTGQVNKFYNIKNSIYWSGSNLSTTKGLISVVNTVAGYIDSVTYKDVAPWDTMAHGHGPSLVLCNPGTTIAYNSTPANWDTATTYVGMVANVAVYGNPGAGCGTVGINNYKETNSDLLCYPNPTRNNLTVAPNGLATDIKMFDILGNVVYETKNVSTTININTSTLSTGMYLLRVTYSDNKVSTRKISIN
jgi:hypothetical protein